LLSAAEIFLGVVHNSHLAFGTLRQSQSRLLFNTLPPALRGRSHQPIASEGSRSIARSE